MVEESVPTAFDAFFDDIESVRFTLLMTYLVEKDILENIPEGLRREIYVVIPKTAANVRALMDLGFDENKIAELPDSWMGYNEIHGKIFVKVKDNMDVEAFVGSNNFTHAGLNKNIETYCVINGEIKDMDYLNNFPYIDPSKISDNIRINAIFDLFVHIFSKSNDKNYLSEHNLRKLLTLKLFESDSSNSSYFVHTAGENTLLTALRDIIRKLSASSQLSVRIISPFLSPRAILSFAEFIRSEFKNKIKLEILTNYLPDFKLYYDSETGFITKEEYENLKNELQRKNIDMELRFWRKTSVKDADDETPAGFIHSKMYFISGEYHGEKKRAMILTSANLSEVAWGLGSEKNLEVGSVEVDQLIVDEVCNYFDNYLWKNSICDTDVNWDIITKTYYEIIEKEILHEIPLKKYIKENKQMRNTPGSYKKGKRGGKLHVGNIEIIMNPPLRDSEYIDEFFKREIVVHSDRYAPSIEDVQLEIRYKSIVASQTCDNHLEYSFTKIRDGEYKLDMHTIKEDLKKGCIIDSLGISAKMNVTANDLVIDISKLKNIHDNTHILIEQNKLKIKRFAKWINPQTKKINIFGITKDGKYQEIEQRKVHIESLPTTLTIDATSTGTNIADFEYVVIQQIGDNRRKEMYRLFGLDDLLKLEKDPIKSIKKVSVNIADMNVDALQIDVSSKYLDMELYDFSFNDGSIDPVGYSKSTKGDMTTFKVIFNNMLESIDVCLKKDLARYYDCSKKRLEISIEKAYVQKTIDNIIARFVPEEIDENDLIKIEIEKKGKNVDCGIEYLKKDLYDHYVRPIDMSCVGEHKIGKLDAGTEIGLRPYVIVGGFRIYTAPWNVKTVENRLFEGIHVEFTFESYKTNLNNLRSKNKSIFKGLPWLEKELKLPSMFFLFSIRISFSNPTTYGFEKDPLRYIRSLRVAYNEDSFTWGKVISSLGRPTNGLFLFFKKEFVEDVEYSPKLKKIFLILETVEGYKNMKIPITIRYKQDEDDDLILEILNEQGNVVDMGKIVNGYKEGEIPTEEMDKINGILRKDYIVDHSMPPQYECKFEEDYLNCKCLILPVWFKKEQLDVEDTKR